MVINPSDPKAHSYRTSDLRIQSWRRLWDFLWKKKVNMGRETLRMMLIPCLLLISVVEIMAENLQEARDPARHSVVITVLSTRGIPIANAIVADDKGRMQYRTDSNGSVEIPCWHGDCAGQAFDIQASGYASIKVTVPADCSGDMPVSLENAGRVVPQIGGNTTSVIELSQQRQARLASLQRAIAGAFVVRDYSRAERMLLEALQLNPSAAWVANDLGIVALQRRNYDEAESWFDKAADAAPFNPDIIGNCGIIRWLQNRTEESHVLLGKAATLGYKSGLGFYVHGILDLKNGQFTDARNNLQHISADQYPYRDLYMSIAWRGLGKAKAADKSFLNYLRRNPVPLLTSGLAEDRRGFGDK